MIRFHREEVRCTGRHPTVSSWECRAKLAEIDSTSVVVKKGARPDLGCVVIECTRCGSVYSICPVERVA